MPATFDRDVRCPCGYNLRGLTLPRRCPECGEPVRLLAGDELWNCDPRWVRRLRVGTVLLVAHAFAYPATLPLVWCIQQYSRGWYYRIGWLLPSIVLTIAVWRLTEPDPRPRASRRVRREATLVRRAALAMLLFSITYWGIHAFNRVHGIGYWREPINRAEIGWTLAWSAVMFLLFRHLARHFRRLRRPLAAPVTVFTGYALSLGMIAFQLHEAGREQLGLDSHSPLDRALESAQFIGFMLVGYGAVFAVWMVLTLWISLNHAIKGLDLVPRRARRDVLTDPRGAPLGPDLYSTYAALQSRP